MYSSLCNLKSIDPTWIDLLHKRCLCCVARVKLLFKHRERRSGKILIFMKYKELDVYQIHIHTVHMQCISFPCPLHCFHSGKSTLYDQINRPKGFCPTVYTKKVA